MSGSIVHCIIYIYIHIYIYILYIHLYIIIYTLIHKKDENLIEETETKRTLFRSIITIIYKLRSEII